MSAAELSLGNCTGRGQRRKLRRRPRGVSISMRPASYVVVKPWRRNFPVVTVTKYLRGTEETQKHNFLSILCQLLVPNPLDQTRLHRAIDFGQVLQLHGPERGRLR